MSKRIPETAILAVIDRNFSIAEIRLHAPAVNTAFASHIGRHREYLQAMTHQISGRISFP